MTERSTQQLAAVLEAVKAERDHPTARDVYTRVCRDLPRVSRGTVYRNLNKLRRQQRIRIVRVADQPTRYDAFVEDHDHFVCDACGAITDLAQGGRQSVLATEPVPSGYVVHSKAISYYGLCPGCTAQRER